MSRIFDANVAQLTSLLDLRVQQHGLVSSNLANADTPEYEATRIDFKTAFSRLLDSDSPLTLRSTDMRHMGGPGVSDGDLPVETIEAPAWSEDGNSVDADHEMSVLMSNNLLYNATIEAMNRKMALIEYAASDGGK